MNLFCKKILLIPIILVISSCGYTLRGSINVPNNVTEISVSSEEYSPIVNSINKILVSNNIEVTNSKNKSLNRIIIVSERFDRRQLSMSITGRVNEYELIYTVNFQINSPLEKSSTDSITLYRDYSFDENNIMGNSDREAYIQNQMMSTASTLIFHKLIAKINNSN
jgi:LPS-assembly lipoprotein